MTEFQALAPLIEPLLDQDFDQLPKEIQAIWKERIVLFGWDAITPGQRLELARQQDYQHDPATQEERQAAFDAVTAVHDLQRQIRDLELAPTPTALDVIAREDRLKTLSVELGQAKLHIEPLRGDYPDASHQVTPGEGTHESEAIVGSDEAKPTARQTSSDSNNSFSPTDFDPLPTSGIAKIFKLTLDVSDNVDEWKRLAKYAARNGLSTSREMAGKGKAESRFNPCGVGDWLVSSGKMSRERVDRILLGNLPPRSAHLRDLLVQ